MDPRIRLMEEVWADSRTRSLLFEAVRLLYPERNSVVDAFRISELERMWLAGPVMRTTQTQTPPSRERWHWRVMLRRFALWLMRLTDG